MKTPISAKIVILFNKTQQYVNRGEDVCIRLFDRLH